jgi:hypothetical protein
MSLIHQTIAPLPNPIVPQPTNAIFEFPDAPTASPRSSIFFGIGENARKWAKNISTLARGKFPKLTRLAYLPHSFAGMQS